MCRRPRRGGRRQRRVALGIGGAAKLRCWLGPSELAPARTSSAAEREVPHQTVGAHRRLDRTDPRRAAPRGSPRSRRAPTAPSSGGAPAPRGPRSAPRGCRRSSTTAPASRPSDPAGATGTRAGPRGGRPAPSAARPCCPRAGRAPSRTRRARSRAGASSAPRRPRRRAAGSPCRARLRDRSSAGAPVAGPPSPTPIRDRCSAGDPRGPCRTRRLATVSTSALWTTLPTFGLRVY